MPPSDGAPMLAQILGKPRMIPARFSIRSAFALCALAAYLLTAGGIPLGIGATGEVVSLAGGGDLCGSLRCGCSAGLQAAGNCCCSQKLGVKRSGASCCSGSAKVARCCSGKEANSKQRRPAPSRDSSPRGVSLVQAAQCGGASLAWATSGAVVVESPMHFVVRHAASSFAGPTIPSLIPTLFEPSEPIPRVFQA